MAQVDLLGGGCEGGTAGSLQGRGDRSGDLGRVGGGGGQGSELRGAKAAAQRTLSHLHSEFSLRTLCWALLSPAPLNTGDTVSLAARVCAGAGSLDYYSPEPWRG